MKKEQGLSFLETPSTLSECAEVSMLAHPFTPSLPHPLTLFLELRPRLDVCDGCSECWLRCSDGVQANREEWLSIQEFLAEASEETQAHIAEVEAQNKAVDLGDEVSVQMCRFFDTEQKNCVIYPVRPLVCRLLGHVEWMPCPIEKVPAPVPTENALGLMRLYATDERKTFAEWEENELA